LLVTGGAGFIGANFVHYWLRRHAGDRIVVLDALTYAGNPANLAPVRERSELRFVHGSICDRDLTERLLREELIDTIVHFAAESHVDRSIAGPDAFIETNIVGTHALLEVVRKLWLGERIVARHRFHHVSTDEVYGSLGPSDPAFHEATPYAPNSPYSASKAASDHLVRAYGHTYGLATTISNCSNNYGPYHFPEKLIPLSIVNILQGKALPVYGDGRNVRDWLYVEDHCRGIDAILAAGTIGQVYNIGGRAECENLQLVRMLCQIADREFEERPQLRSLYPACPAARGELSAALITFVADRPGHDRRYAIDCSKIERELTFRPGIALSDGLQQTFRWFTDHEPWWRDVINGSYRQWIAQQYHSSFAGTQPADRPQQKVVS
jgi:dTDP-glucose 4,6-dehydratase